VPFEMLVGANSGRQETVRRTIASGRIFSSNMHEICRHVQTLLRVIYCEIYSAKQEDVEFVLVPMPRLEVETIADFKVLHEIGALTPDMTLKLSRILLGDEPMSTKNRAPAPGNPATEPFPEKQAPKEDKRPNKPEAKTARRPRTP